MVSYPNPRIPSNRPNAKARPGSSVASANNWFLIFMPAKSRLSELIKPERLPLPYRISKEVPFSLYVDEADESYLLWRKQAMEVHFVDGTQRLELPVSRT